MQTSALAAVVSKAGGSLIAKAAPFVRRGDEWVLKLDPFPPELIESR